MTSRCPAEPLIVVIEGVEKPGNLGAVLRSADGAGVDAVIAASPRTDLVQPERHPSQRRHDLQRPARVGPDGGGARLAARDAAIRIVAALVDAEPLYTDADLTGPLAIVLGSEAAG